MVQLVQQTLEAIYGLGFLIVPTQGTPGVSVELLALVDHLQGINYAPQLHSTPTHSYCTAARGYSLFVAETLHDFASLRRSKEFWEASPFLDEKYRKRIRSFTKYVLGYCVVCCELCLCVTCRRRCYSSVECASAHSKSEESIAVAK